MNRSAKMYIYKKVSIIIVNYNNADLTIDCVDSILRSTYKNVEIIVVDNGSTDNSVDILKKCESITLLMANENRGFAAGNNIGINYSMETDAAYIMLLNNDTIIDEKMIELMVDSMNTNRVVVPTIYYYDQPDTIWYAGGYIDKKRCSAVHNTKIDKKEKIDFASGCCFMSTSEAFAQVGNLCEDYFMYWEDVDYSMRIKKYNLELYLVKDAKMWHKVGASSGRRSRFSNYYETRNRLYFLKKYNLGLNAKLFVLLSRIFRIIMGIILNNEDKYILDGLVDYYKGITGKVEIK